MEGFASEGEKRLGWRMPRWVLLLAAILSALQVCAQERPSYGMRTDGRKVESLAPAGTKAVVLFFVASDCPVSNRTFPEMKRLREEFAARGVSFWFVYANAGERPEETQRHQEAYDAGGEALLDVTGALTEMSGARVTPEVSVLVRHMKPHGGRSIRGAWMTDTCRLAWSGRRPRSTSRKTR